MENWPQKKKEEFIHKIKKFREYLNRKKIASKTLSNIAVTVHIMSTIIEFLLIKPMQNIFTGFLTEMR